MIGCSFHGVNLKFANIFLFIINCFLNLSMYQLALPHEQLVYMPRLSIPLISLISPFYPQTVP